MRPPRRPKSVQEAPRRLQDAPRGLQDARRDLQDTPKDLQEASKDCPERQKSLIFIVFFRCFWHFRLFGLPTLQDSPRTSQDCSKTAQEAPTTHPESSQTAQEPPKTAQEAPGDGPKRGLCVYDAGESRRPYFKSAGYSKRAVVKYSGRAQAHALGRRRPRRAWRREAEARAPSRPDPGAPRLFQPCTCWPPAPSPLAQRLRRVRPTW